MKNQAKTVRISPKDIEIISALIPRLSFGARVYLTESGGRIELEKGFEVLIQTDWYGEPSLQVSVKGPPPTIQVYGRGSSGGESYMQGYQGAMQVARTVTAVLTSTLGVEI